LTVIKLKSSCVELMEQLNELSPFVNNSSFLPVIERKARSLLKSDAAHAWEVLACVELKRNHYKLMVECFNKAKNLRPYDDVLKMNMAVGLQQLGYNEEAVDIAKLLIDRNRDNLPVLHNLLNIFNRALAFKQAMVVAELLKKLNQSEGGFQSFLLENNPELETHLSLLETNGIESEELIKRHDVALQFLIKKNVLTPVRTPKIFSDGCLRIVHEINASPKEAALMNFEIAAVLIDTFDDLLSDYLIISTNPVSHLVSVEA
jgi:tetratricopeptide (TPR) repeat protein